MGGKGAKQRRIEKQRKEDKGSENVRKKRAFYKRWATMSDEKRREARRLGQKGAR